MKNQQPLTKPLQNDQVPIQLLQNQKQPIQKLQSQQPPIFKPQSQQTAAASMGPPPFGFKGPKIITSADAFGFESSPNQTNVTIQSSNFKQGSAQVAPPKPESLVIVALRKAEQEATEKMLVSKSRLLSLEEAKVKWNIDQVSCQDLIHEAKRQYFFYRSEVALCQNEVDHIKRRYEAAESDTDNQFVSDIFCLQKF